MEDELSFSPEGVFVLFLVNSVLQEIHFLFLSEKSGFSFPFPFPKYHISSPSAKLIVRVFSIKYVNWLMILN